MCSGAMKESEKLQQKQHNEMMTLLDSLKQKAAQARKERSAQAKAKAEAAKIVQPMQQE